VRGPFSKGRLTCGQEAVRGGSRLTEAGCPDEVFEVDIVMRKPVVMGKSVARNLHQCVNRMRIANEPSPERIYHPAVQPLYALGLAVLTVDTALTAEAADEHHRIEEILRLVQRSNRASSAMTQLTPQCRKMVTLIFLQGLSHAETATDGGRDLGAVKSDLRRALTQLQEALQE
jgi:RNA polymerase sigma factor (sigma-70 family)